jgi:hypothetical protein
MRLSGFLMVLAIVLLVAGNAEARKTPWYSWVFTPDKDNYERPYMEDGKTPHNSQWENDPWVPEGWAQDLGSKEAVLERFEDAGYVDDISVDEGDKIKNATVKVGRPFLMLSDLEKNHVIKYVDYYYGISHTDGSIIVERSDGFWFFKRPSKVGVYTKRGLQLQ